MSSLDLLEEQQHQNQQLSSNSNSKRTLRLDLVSSCGGFVAACTSTTGRDKMRLGIWWCKDSNSNSNSTPSILSFHSAWHVIDTPHSKLLALELAVVVDKVIVVATTSDELLCRWDIKCTFDPHCDFGPDLNPVVRYSEFSIGSSKFSKLKLDATGQGLAHYDGERSLVLRSETLQKITAFPLNSTTAAVVAMAFASCDSAQFLIAAMGNGSVLGFALNNNNNNNNNYINVKSVSHNNDSTSNNSIFPHDNVNNSNRNSNSNGNNNSYSNDSNSNDSNNSNNSNNRTNSNSNKAVLTISHYTSTPSSLFVLPRCRSSELPFDQLAPSASTLFYIGVAFADGKIRLIEVLRTQSDEDTLQHRETRVLDLPRALRFPQTAADQDYRTVGSSGSNRQGSTNHVPLALHVVPCSFSFSNSSSNSNISSSSSSYFSPKSLKKKKQPSSAAAPAPAPAPAAHVAGAANQVLVCAATATCVILADLQSSRVLGVVNVDSLGFSYASSVNVSCQLGRTGHCIRVAMQSAFQLEDIKVLTITLIKTGQSVSSPVSLSPSSSSSSSSSSAMKVRYTRAESQNTSEIDGALDTLLTSMAGLTATDTRSGESPQKSPPRSPQRRKARASPSKPTTEAAVPLSFPGPTRVAEGQLSFFMTPMMLRALERDSILRESGDEDGEERGGRGREGVAEKEEEEDADDNDNDNGVWELDCPNPKPLPRGMAGRTGTLARMLLNKELVAVATPIIHRGTTPSRATTASTATAKFKAAHSQARGTWETPAAVSKGGKVVDLPVTFHARVKSSGYGQTPTDLFERKRQEAAKRREREKRDKEKEKLLIKTASLARSKSAIAPRSSTPVDITGGPASGAPLAARLGGQGELCAISRRGSAAHLRERGPRLRKYPLDCGPATLPQPLNTYPSLALKPPAEYNPAPMYSVSYNGDASQLGVASADSAVLCLRLPVSKYGEAGGESVVSYMGHDLRIGSVAYSHCKDKSGAYRLLSSSADCTARMWRSGRVDASSVVFSHSKRQPGSGHAQLTSTAGGSIGGSNKAATTTAVVASAARNRPYGSEVSDAQFYYQDKFTALCVRSSLLLYCYSPDGTDAANDLKRLHSTGKYRLAAEWSFSESAQLVTAMACVNSIQSPLLLCATSNKALAVVDACVGRVARVVESPHQKPIHCIALPQPSVHVSLPTDAYTLFATAAADNVIALWDVRTPQPVARFSGSHKNSTSSHVRIALSPCGRYLASGSEDRSARILDLRGSGRELAKLPGHRDVVTGVAFSPLFPQLATCSYDGTVRFYVDPLVSASATQAVGIF